MSVLGSNAPLPYVRLQPALRADYHLLGLVGQGQFAQVYCAVHRRTGRLVAIKETRHARQSASQECLVLPALDHPNVIGCRAVSKTKTGYRLVLDYCEAGTLRSHLDSHLSSIHNTSQALPLSETQALVGDLLQGLDYLHKYGIVHGDLKPENLFLTYQPSHANANSSGQKSNRSFSAAYPHLKIGDFGSAQLPNQPNRHAPQNVETQSVASREIGSPTYAAPERFNGLSSIATDLYAVGVMLYELLVGDRPFSGSPKALEQAHKTSAVSFPTTLTAQAKQLLTKALHKQPEQRFSSAAEIRMALRQLSAIATEPAIPLSSLTAIPETSLSQSMTLVPSNGITAPIESLIHVPQGCCIATEKSLHLLTPTRKLLSIARFKRPCWITVAPNGKWFAAVSKKDKVSHLSSSLTKRDKSQRSPEQFSQGMIGRLSNQSGHQWRAAITLKGRLLTELCANVLRVIALNNRYLLRISTTPFRTYLECFTRRGQFIGELSLNFRLTQVTPTAVPYQLIALRAPTFRASTEASTASNSMVLITLKPFQVRTIPLPVAAEQISALPWGYLVSYQRHALLLDRSAQVASLLTGLPSASKVAILSKRTLLLTSGNASSVVSSPTYQLPIAYKSSEPLSLLVANTAKLDLGLIF